MSMTYTNNTTSKLGREGRPLRPAGAPRTPDAEEPIVPSYLRRTARPQKKMRSWMILAPIGGLVLLGGAVVMLFNPAEEPAAPLAEPAPVTAPAAGEPTLTSPSALEASAGAPVVIAESAPAPVATPPVSRTASAPASRPQASSQTPPSAASSQATSEVAEPTGPRPYAPNPSTQALNTAPATGATATPPPTSAPVIATRPLTPPQG